MQSARPDLRFLLLFFAVAYGWTWAFWVPVALEVNGLVKLPDTFAWIVAGGQPAAWGPLIAAVLVAILSDGLTGLRNLIASMTKGRFSVLWYLVAILFLPTVVGTAQLIAWLAGEHIPASPAFTQPASIPIAFVWIFFLAGPLQEEAGWRGTSTRLFQNELGALGASLITGLFWGLWHLPLFFMQREEVYYNQPIWGLLISTTLLSVLHTWIYNSTGRSLFAAMLMHASWNWSNYLFTGLQTDTGGLVFLLLLTFVAILVTVRFGPGRLALSDA